MIGFISRKLKKHQSNYSLPEKEALGLIMTLEFFRVCVLSHQIEARVDQIGVINILKRNHPSKYYKFRERLVHYNSKVVYVKRIGNKDD